MTGLFNELPARLSPRSFEPRASLIYGPAGLGELWMGGAHSAQGAEISASGLADALVIDCAGDLPDRHREAAGSWLSCVFADLETFPSQMDRITETARAAAATLRNGSQRPVFVFCQYGMNRSGLLTGLVLRELGLQAGDAVARIRAIRPGALSNLTFLRLIDGNGSLPPGAAP